MPSRLFLLMTLLAACTGRTAQFEATETGEEEGDAEEFQGAPKRQLGHAKSASFLLDVQNLGWKDTGGRGYCLWQDASDPDHIFTGSASGGLWTTHDRGTTWQPVQDWFFPMSVLSITQDELAPDTMYMSTQTALEDEDGVPRTDILRSVDHGQTFDYLPAGGTAWQNVRKVVAAPDVMGRIYAACNLPGLVRTVVRSDDAGETFTEVFSETAGQDFSDLEVLPGGSVYIALGQHIYRSPTGDPGTYTAMNTGAMGDVYSIAYCQQEPARMYAEGSQPGPTSIYRSDDGGTSWAFTDTMEQSITGRMLEVRPDDPDVVITGRTGMFITLNGGETWEHWQGLGVDHWELRFDRSDPSKAFAILDGGFGEIGTEPFDPYPFNVQFARDSLMVTAQMYHGDVFPNGLGFIAGCQDLGTSMANDEGQRIPSYVNDGAYCFIHKQDTSVAYVSWQQGHIARDDDLLDPYLSSVTSIMNQLDADNNNSIDEGALFVHPYLALDLNSDVLFFPTKQRLWRSVDRGDNWTPISNSYNTGSFLSIAASSSADPTVYWSEGDSLFVLDNALSAAPGTEIRRAPDLGSIVRVWAHPVRDSVVYIGVAADIYRCDDPFATTPVFTEITADLPFSGGHKAFAVDPQNDDLMFVGNREGLFFTTDGGTTWERETGLPPVQVEHLELRGRRLFAFTYGRGCWTGELPEGVEGLTEQHGNDLHVFPSPFSDRCTVSSTGPPLRRVEVFDVQGRRLATVSCAACQTLPLPVEKLPDAGTCILQVYRTGLARPAPLKIVRGR